MLERWVRAGHLKSTWDAGGKVLEEQRGNNHRRRPSWGEWRRHFGGDAASAFSGPTTASLAARPAESTWGAGDLAKSMASTAPKFLPSLWKEGVELIPTAGF